MHRDRSTKAAEVDSIPTSVNPRKGRKGRTSVVEAEKKGKELVRPSDNATGGQVTRSAYSPPRVMRSRCYDCDHCYDGRCPLNMTLVHLDIVVFVDECGQWQPRK